MPYIGKTPTVGNFQVCDAISVVNGQAAYTLQVGGVNVAPESANHMLVSLNGILQKPGSSFTISGSTMTFASNLATGDVIDFVQILGNVLDLGQPSDDTVTAAKLNDNVISGQTALTSEPDDTDEFLVSDAGTIKRIDYSLIKASPAMELLSSTDASSSSAVSLDLFSSTYKNYKMLISNLVGSDNDWLRLRFRRSSADVNSSTYYNANFQTARVSGSTQDFNNSEWQGDEIKLFVTSGNSSYPGSSEITIYDPHGTSYTQMTALSTYWENAGSSYRSAFTGAILQDATTSVTGITVSPSSGNITGNVKLYGIK